MFEILNILFVTYFIIFPILLYLIYNYLGYKISNVGIPQVLILALFVFSYVGVLPLFFGWDEYRFSSGVNDKIILFKVLINSSITILGVSLGVLTLNKFIPLKSVNILRQKIPSVNKLEINFIAILLIFTTFIFYKYLTQVDQIALFLAVSGDVAASQLARSSMTNGFENYHWYSLVFSHLMFFISFTSLAYYLYSKSSVSLIFAILSISITLFSTIVSTEKAPLLWFVIGLFLTYLVVKKNGEIPLRKASYFILLLTVVLVLLYVFFMGHNDIGTALSSLFSRSFAGSIQPAYHYLEFFPQEQGFLFGRSFPNPLGVLPFEPYLLTVEVMNWVNPKDVQRGIIGTMPTVFWGELYANFGYFGILVFPFLVGFFLSLLDKMIFYLEANIIRIGFYIWCILRYKDLSITGISGFLIDFYAIFMILVFIFLTIIINKFSLKIYYTLRVKND